MGNGILTNKKHRASFILGVFVLDCYMERSVTDKLVSEMSKTRNFNVPIKVHICKDFKRELPKYITHRIRLEKYLENNLVTDCLGMFVPYEKDYLHILIAPDADEFTLIHETTHAIDFHKYILKFCNGDFDNYQDNEKYPLSYTFRLASEFHARVIPHTKYVANLQRDIWTVKEHMNDNEKLLYHHCHDFLSQRIDINRFFYEVMQTLGKIHVWQIALQSTDNNFELSTVFQNIVKMYRIDEPPLLYLFGRIQDMYSVLPKIDFDKVDEKLLEQLKDVFVNL